MGEATNILSWPLRALYILLSLLFLLLGVLGVFLPGLPTTPFLLLMSYFLIQVSPRLHDRVLAIPLIGKPLREWKEKGGVRPGVKWLAYSMVALLVGLGWFYRDLKLPMQIGITICALIGIYVVYRLPTIDDDVSK